MIQNVFGIYELKLHSFNKEHFEHMKEEKLSKLTLIWITIIFIILGGILSIYWFIYLNIAHSTFENYYKFRECTELINKTDYYGYCKINSEKIIKIVKYQDKWYLNNDLPVSCGFINCP
jgi:hypothetical protein